MCSTQVHAWGSWLARFHRVSRQFTAEFPVVSARIQRWDQVHDNILKDAPLHAAEQAAMADPTRYGVLHGDLNCSNFFFVGTYVYLG